MGATVSIKIRDCERINLVRELYHDKTRTKELFTAILKHGEEVEKISRSASLLGGKSLFLADVICYITKKVDPFMTNFFGKDVLELNSNALSQIVAAAFDYAVKLGAVTRRQTFVKKVTTNHKFAELKSKYFSNFLAALVYFDHLWDIFDIADDNIDDDSIFLGEFMRARHRITEIEGVTFLREVTDESWKKEFGKIDNGDEKDGWISFLEFARYAALKIKSPEDYITNTEKVWPVEEDNDKSSDRTPRRRTTRRTQCLRNMKIEKQPKIFGNQSSVGSGSPKSPASDAGSRDRNKDDNALKSAATAMEAAQYMDKTVEIAKHTSSGESSFARPKSLLARYNEKLSSREEATQNNRRSSLFKVVPANSKDKEQSPGEDISKKIVVGQEKVVTHRNTAFMNRLRRDEEQIRLESEAAATMNVSVELSQELVDTREKNYRMSMRPVGGGRVKRRTTRKKTLFNTTTTTTTVSPFSFAEVSIHHVKPNSYAALCEEKRLKQLETFGKPLHQKVNDYVDERVFSIHNLNKVVNALKAKQQSDLDHRESNGLMTARPRENSLEDVSAAIPLVTNVTPENDQVAHSAAAAKKKENKEKEETKKKMNFRNKIEKYIAEGQASNQLRQHDRVRPKSASSTVTKTSLEEFEKQSKPSEVQSFFSNYSDADKSHRTRPSTSVNEKNTMVEPSASLMLSSKNEGSLPEKQRVRPKTSTNSPYIDDISVQPHLVRGKFFIDHGDRDQKRFGNLRFDNQVFIRRPLSGHFPSKHDTLHGAKQYELWDSKRNQSLLHPENEVPLVDGVPRAYSTFTGQRSPSPQKTPLRSRSGHK